MTNPVSATTVGSSLVALVLGAGVGLVTTFAHRQYVVDVGIPIPIGLVVGLVIVAALLVGVRLVFDSRVVALAGAVGVLGAIVVLALPGAGRSAIILDDAVGYVWAVGSVVIALAVTVLPGRPPRDV